VFKPPRDPPGRRKCQNCARRGSPKRRERAATVRINNLFQPGGSQLLAAASRLIGQMERLYLEREHQRQRASREAGKRRGRRRGRADGALGPAREGDGRRQEDARLRLRHRGRGVGRGGGGGGVDDLGAAVGCVEFWCKGGG
jgi:hypothetical protein